MTDGTSQGRGRVLALVLIVACGLLVLPVLVSGVFGSLFLWGAGDGVELAEQVNVEGEPARDALLSLGAMIGFGALIALLLGAVLVALRALSKRG